ncbi:MAG TPA: hypothetical protein DCQ36_06750 [Actinobacteria bacterium]|jgi:VanZ family protein|nr:hypothetical protein [Actinomycetota bacterium]
MTSLPLLGARTLLAVAAIGIAWTSLLPPDDLPSSFGLSDKVIHLIGYMVLGILAVLSGIRWPWALGSVIAFGLLLEIAQGLLGYRSFEWADLGADALGALAGVIITDRIMREVRRSRGQEAQRRKREQRRQRRESARNPAPERMMNRERVAARKGAPTWKQVAQRQGGKCWLCGTRTYEEDRTREASGRERLGATYPCVDYVVAIDAGGTYEETNVRLAHRHCAAVRREKPSLTSFGRPPRTYS